MTLSNDSRQMTLHFQPLQRLQFSHLLRCVANISLSNIYSRSDSPLCLLSCHLWTETRLEWTLLIVRSNLISLCGQTPDVPESENITQHAMWLCYITRIHPISFCSNPSHLETWLISINDGNSILKRWNSPYSPR